MICILRGFQKLPKLVYCIFYLIEGINNKVNSLRNQAQAILEAIQANNLVITLMALYFA